MNNSGEPSNLGFDAGEGTSFHVRWRGRQEGPYPAEVIDKKLAANEIGMLHEILHKGQWISIRDYIAQREATLRAQQQAREEEERREREIAERKAKEREEETRAALLAEERRRNDLIAAGLERQSNASHASGHSQIPLKPHRGGTILTLALIGLFIFGVLCLIAWVMGSNDLREMDAGTMDPNGRSTTSSGRNIGMLGTILWVVAVFFYFNQ
jgi:hypothetical protein